MVMTSDTKITAEGTANARATTPNLAFGLFGRKLAKPQETKPPSEATSGKVELAA